MKRLLLIVPLVLVCLSVQSQEFRGKLINKKDLKPVEFAIVQIAESGQWVVSGTDGVFTFDNLKMNKVTLIIRHIGMQSFHKSYEINYFNNRLVVIQLTPQSFDMPEIKVVATKGKEAGSVSNISKEAIEHAQANTLGDVMQLLPGNLIEESDLTKKQTISIREIDNSYNSAIGTAIIIDGVPLNNDANYQVYGTNQMSTNSTSVNGVLPDNLASATAGGGIDLRSIAVDNIESVEVIKGIPSVQYGNLTSGAVIVKTKSGPTPLEARIKTDPKAKHLSIGKGLGLKNGNALNCGVSYTQSYKDPRSQYTSFDRITANLAYSAVFFKSTKPLSLKTGMSYSRTLNEKKTDPEALVNNEVITQKESGLQYNTDLKWQLNKAFLTNLEGKFSVSSKWQEDYLKLYRNGIQKISLAQNEGENEGIYLPSESLTELTIKGLPVNINLDITGNKHWALAKGSYNNLLAGIQFSSAGNYGDGRIYDITNPPSVGRNATRPRSFKDIPAQKFLSLFIEDKHVQSIGNTVLTTQAGVRINNFQPAGLFKSDLGFYVEPRLNIDYKLYQSKSAFLKEFSIHGGIGLNYKAPPLLYLYPDKAYSDLVSLDHYKEEPDLALAWFTTNIFDTSNKDLKPSKNLKKEIGITIKLGCVKGDITAFNENLSDGFGMLERYHFIDYNRYDDSGVPEDEKPDVNELPFSNETYTISYSSPVNNKQTRKYGVEYDFDFGKVKAMSTRITMNGAWLRTKRVFSTLMYDDLPTKDGAGQYNEIGVYAAGEGKVSERMNTTFRFITHSSRLRLIFTTTMQITWMDKNYYTYYDGAPVYLYTRDEPHIAFTNEMRNNPDFRKYVNIPGELYYVTESLPPKFLFIFRLSKEIKERFKLSFYANNFFNHRPLHQSQRSLTFTRGNIPIAFGAELMIKL